MPPPYEIPHMPLSHVEKFATYTVGKGLAATCGCQTNIFCCFYGCRDLRSQILR